MARHVLLDNILIMKVFYCDYIHCDETYSVNNFLQCLFLHLRIIQSHLIKICIIIPGLFVSKSVLPSVTRSLGLYNESKTEDCAIIL